MAMLRINKKQNYFCHKSLDHPNLTWAAKGLHTYLMSLPHDSQILVKQLIQTSKNGRESVQNLIIELKNAGYITSKWKLTEQFIGQEYHVYEYPQLTNLQDLEMSKEKFQVHKNLSREKSPKPNLLIKSIK